MHEPWKQGGGKPKPLGPDPGPWFVTKEGEALMIKREIFKDGAHAGYELLDGDYKKMLEDHLKDLSEALQNMVGIFDNPLARRQISDSMSNEAREEARKALRKYGVKL